MTTASELVAMGTRRARRIRRRPIRSAIPAVLLAGFLHLQVQCFVLQPSRPRHPSNPWLLDRQDAPLSFHQRRRGYRNSLTTKVNGEEEPVELSILGHLRKARDKFNSKPGTYLLIPVIAAFVGWFTNWLAVQMIFYPIKFRGIPIWIQDEVPLGFLGWQGIVPCKTRKMSEAMVEMVTSQLLTVKDAFARLDPGELAKRLAPEVPKLGEEVIQDILPKKWLVGLPRAVYFGLPGASQRLLQFFNFRFLRGMCADMIANVDSCFNIQNCVQEQMLQDRSLLGQLFKKCGQRELDFLTNSGLWFGFLLGLIQMAVALFYDNPWTLSIGGLIVGLATNWLALKWIFEPVNPTKFGPFILQGQFLRRQKEVSAEFSKFFANRILTSNQVWNSILTDPTTSPSFYALFARHFIGFANKVTGALRINVEPEVIQMATKRAMTKLPEHVPVLHSYIDSTLGLEGTLRVKMEQMTASQFERVLHPIFEEDELTLILAGAALGFIAGLIQQGLETGKIKLPDVWTPVAKRVGPYLEYPLHLSGVVSKKMKARFASFRAAIRPKAWTAPNGSNVGSAALSSSSTESTKEVEKDGDSESIEEKEDDHDNSTDADETL